MLTSRKLEIFRLLKNEGFSIGNIIILLLRERGVALSDIAIRAKVHRSFVSKAVSGKRKPDNIKQAISSELGFDPWNN